MKNATAKEGNRAKDEVARRISVLHIRMMTDEEWNRLAYRNYLERKALAI